MSRRKVIALINLAVSGFIALMISTFFAGGTIAENYTDKTYVAPEFFVIMIIWGIGALLVVGQFLFKDKLALFLVSLLVTWASIPIGVKIGFSLAVT